MKIIPVSVSSGARVTDVRPLESLERKKEIGTGGGEGEREREREKGYEESFLRARKRSQRA